ncbi:lipoprotein insertase outer membrane protein LolB [Undibacterium sp. Di26W]|uniref:lipoprotein insertase outer membrane protein LolB n=1 Tax=Undibacterium sp. Di26W TaxID=3413035 RepID=UPI003BEF998A
MHNKTSLPLHIAASVCLLLCSACSSLHQQASTANNTPAASLNTQQTALGAARVYQQQIQISGRITVLYQQADKPQSMPGNFEWEQDQDGIRITLLSSLGQTLARITQTAQGARLEQNGKETRQAADLDLLLQDTLGWSLPVAGLRDWLQGFVAKDGKTAMPVQAEDQTIDTQGWKLRYATWHEQPSFPKRIDLQRYSSQAGDISIRIVIDQWK